MKKWQKSWMALLASSLAIGWMAQAEATVIKIEGVSVNEAQPLKVIIVDSNGNTFEQNAPYNSYIGGIDIDTRWAGPNASIYIPDLGIGYIWYNGYWVDREGYYWNGAQRMHVPHMPQWKEHWRHYWHAHRPKGWHESWRERFGDWKEKWQHRGEDRQARSEGWQSRSEGEQNQQGWQSHGEGWSNSGTPRGTMSPGGYEGRQPGAMRSGPQSGQPSDDMSGSSHHGQ